MSPFFFFCQVVPPFSPISPPFLSILCLPTTIVCTFYVESNCLLVPSLVSALRRCRPGEVLSSHAPLRQLQLRNSFFSPLSSTLPFFLFLYFSQPTYPLSSFFSLSLPSFLFCFILHPLFFLKFLAGFSFKQVACSVSLCLLSIVAGQFSILIPQSPSRGQKGFIALQSTLAHFEILWHGPVPRLARHNGATVGGVGRAPVLPMALERRWYCQLYGIFFLSRQLKVLNRTLGFSSLSCPGC